MNPNPKYKKLEIMLITFGIIIMLCAYLVHSKRLQLITSPELTATDPFASQYSNPIPLAEASPTPTETNTSSLITTPTPNPTSEVHISLIYPTANAILTRAPQDKTGYPLQLKFEVNPKNTPCTLELKHAGETVLTKPLTGSPSGFFEISLMIKKTGSFSWQITSSSGISELRVFSIK